MQTGFIRRYAEERASGSTEIVERFGDSRPAFVKRQLVRRYSSRPDSYRGLGTRMERAVGRDSHARV